MHAPLSAQPDLVPVSSSAPSRWRVPACLLVAALAAVALLDAPVARADLHKGLPRIVVQMVNQAELFGDGAAIILVFAAVWALDPRGRRKLVRLMCAAWGAGIAANIVKLCIARERPYQWLAQAADGSAWSQFSGWFPFGTAGNAMQSFPSAHTATAFGLALGLSACYPHARGYFLAMAALTACQRVIGDMHYVSDTLAAAAVAWCVAHALYGDTKIAQRFTSWERRRGAQAPLLPAVERRAA
jgi:membrane-associated phospholipid phosphatase